MWQNNEAYEHHSFSLRKKMWQTEKHKKGRRHYGYWLKNTSTGVVIYIAKQPHKQILRLGEASTSEAMRKGVACFAIPSETLMLAKIKGAKFIGVKIKDLGMLYLTSIDEFYDPANMRLAAKSVQSGASKRYVPLDRFRVSSGMKL